MTRIIEQIAPALRSAAPSRDDQLPCAHCGLPVPQSWIDQAAVNQFCCAGCRAVYETLQACGLESYYQIRDSINSPSQPAHVTGGKFSGFDSEEFARLYVIRHADGLATVDLALEGVSCAACVWLLERLPGMLNGVVEARLSLREAMVRITWNPSRLPLSRIGQTLDRLGYKPYPARGQSGRERHVREGRRRLLHLGVAGAIMGNVMLLAFGLYAGGHGQMDPQFRMFFRWISALLATLSLAWPGATFFRSAWAAIRLRAVNLDVPIAMALAVGSVAGLVNVVLNRGEIYFDSLTVLIFLLLIGRFLQYQQQRRADDAVGLLFNLTPSSCRIVNNGQALERPIESLAAGDLIEVWSGEIFPADGVVETGASSVNEALLTGESTPAAVSVGSPVHAGSQNVGGVLQVRVKSVGAGTRVGHLMRLVEQGVHDKPQIAQFTDKVGRWFVVIVAMAAVATFFFWLYHQGLSPAIDHSVALLIVTCPCVLGLATPMTIAIAIGKLARHDILVKSGVALERLSHGGSMVLDKTGTLTDGRLQLLGWVGDDSIKGVVAEMERRSVHPVGIALRDALSTCELDAASRVSLSGAVQMCDAGVIAKLGASSIHVGSPSFLAKHRIEIPDAMELAIAATEAAGLTAVGVASNGQVVAIAALGDRLREDSKASVARLRKMGWEPSILSGDAQTVVQSISRKVGIESEWALGRQTPEDKLRHVTHRNHDKVLVMVGDGVNDAAALAAADVGIAVHGGAEASLAAADVYIARPGLQGLVELAYTSRDVMRTIRRNLGISLTYNLFAGIMAATGLMTPLLAAIVMPVSSATVLGFAILSVTRIDRHWLKSQPQPTVEYEEGP